MILADIIKNLNEGAVGIYGRTGGKLVRKYRCTSGQKKGRIVAKAATCNTPIKVSKSAALKRTKARKAPIIKIKSRFTKRTNARSLQLQRQNKSRMKPTRRSTKRRRM